MMHGGMMRGMMWGMGLVWLLLIILLVLGVAALAKYLFSRWRRTGNAAGASQYGGAAGASVPRRTWAMFVSSGA